MIIWENRQDIGNLLKFLGEDWIDELESIGSRYCKMVSSKSIGEVIDGKWWYKRWKVWEYPITLALIEAYKEKFNKDYLRILDFGCWISPFPELVARRLKRCLVIGYDNDSWGDLKKVGIWKYNTNVIYDTYRFDNLEFIIEDKFDIIYSCSVLEHISEDELYDDVKTLDSMLKGDGMHFHIIDVYNKSNRKNVNIKKLMDMLGWEYRKEDLPSKKKLIEVDKNRVCDKDEYRILVGNEITSIVWQFLSNKLDGK